MENQRTEREANAAGALLLLASGGNQRQGQATAAPNPFNSHLGPSGLAIGSSTQYSAASNPFNSHSGPSGPTIGSSTQYSAAPIAPEARGIHTGIDDHTMYNIRVFLENSIETLDFWIVRLGVMSTLMGPPA
ncbi:hypothetical protein NUW58_g5291 [Xylaria curta]|uniref:Uncharacterized protein n=1 Tax=Xylaria curta TaxID=42375 RepID=A0ACC1P298_9PEZI|nr:hypothetical protein NUW58_g5291 [Xylaria curta]